MPGVYVISVVVPRLWRYPQKNRAGRCQGLILAPLTRQDLLPKPAS
jgi:hypothetical protein